MTNQLAVCFLAVVFIFSAWVQFRHEKDVGTHSWVERGKVVAVSVFSFALFVLLFVISMKAYAGVSLALFVFTSFIMFDGAHGLYRIIRNGCLNGWLASIAAFMWMNNAALLSAA